MTLRSLVPEGLRNADRRKLLRLYLVLLLPATLFGVLKASAAPPILYPFCLISYAALAGWAALAYGTRFAGAFLSVAVVGVAAARFPPLEGTLNPQDLNVIGFFEVKPGESVEQMFWLPEHQWSLDRLRADPEMELVLRLLGRFDTEATTVSLNGQAPRRMAELLIRKGGNFYGMPVQNHMLTVPMACLNGTRITLRVSSPAGFTLAYSSGIHPLPAQPHSLLIHADGTSEDLSDRYFHRRFRFQNALHIVSRRYHVSQSDDPLIFGTIR